MGGGEIGKRKECNAVGFFSHGGRGTFMPRNTLIVVIHYPAGVGGGGWGEEDLLGPKQALEFYLCLEITKH